MASTGGRKNMTNLWNPGSSIAAGERLNRLVDHDPPAFAWVNRAQYADAIQAGGSILGEDGFPLGQVRGVDLSSLPRPRLRCDETSFAPDLKVRKWLYDPRFDRRSYHPEA